jgi:hypothetical protein
MDDCILIDYRSYCRGGGCCFLFCSTLVGDFEDDDDVDNSSSNKKKDLFVVLALAEQRIDNNVCCCWGFSPLYTSRHYSKCVTRRHVTMGCGWRMTLTYLLMFLFGIKRIQNRVS